MDSVNWRMYYWWFGDTPISFDNQYLQIGDKWYLISSGLLELLFKQNPEEAYANSDEFDN